MRAHEAVATVAASGPHGPRESGVPCEIDGRKLDPTDGHDGAERERHIYLARQAVLLQDGYPHVRTCMPRGSCRFEVGRCSCCRGASIPRQMMNEPT